MQQHYAKQEGESITWDAESVAWLEGLAAASGFDAAGVAALADDAAEQQQAERYTAWVEAGRAGEMEYLKRRDEQGVLIRSAVRRAFPWARSVVVCARNYNAGGPHSIQPAPHGTGWIARYAWSGRQQSDGSLGPTDYHEELLGAMASVQSALQQRFGAAMRCYVDTGPLVERAMAVKAGLGWTGKNTCLLHPKLGSWLLLAVLVTDIPMPVEVAPLPDRCGSCTRCLDACPTGALVAPREMDASRCIAYLTIEKKGSIAEELRAGMGRQVFGCDICQEVCPWNRKAPVVQRQGSYARPELVNPALEWLAGMDAPAFRRWFRGSPLERTRRSRLLRNVAIAMGNSGLPQYTAQLQAWAAGQDPVLAEAAAWALARLPATATP
ncbi:MAG: tRNA epoxyqueuosine(34) reductase QueG [Acidobacteriota bacterium]|nr:tRNA epoxyqueuosine(34) reductase QueG [Acidobacteriota bacterium]